MSTLDRQPNDGSSTQASAPMRPRDAAQWWVRLDHAVSELARRYPRTYGTTIPATWRDDPDTVELLACITAWRQELDEQAYTPPDEHDHTQLDEHETPEPDAPKSPAARLECSRQEWEWHAHRDQWLARVKAGRKLTPFCRLNLDPPARRWACSEWSP